VQICIGGPQDDGCRKRAGIEVLDNSEVEAVIRMPVGYRVHVRQKPRYGRRGEVRRLWAVHGEVPRQRPRPDKQGNKQAEAIYLPHSNAIPRKHVIDPETCLYLTKGSCRLCERVCPNQAINFKDEEKFKDLYVGSIIVATGVDNWDARSTTNTAQRTRTLSTSSNLPDTSTVRPNRGRSHEAKRRAEAEEDSHDTVRR